MHSAEHNLALLEEALSTLENFILSDSLLWPLPSKNVPGFPSLSLGSILLALDELNALEPEMNPNERERFQHLRQQIDEFFRKWRTAVGMKAEREIRMRSTLWRAYKQEIKENADPLQDYANEVRNRVMISRLADLTAGGSLSEADMTAQQLQENERPSLAPKGSFVWDMRLKDTYPFEKFPFLYR